MKKIEEVTAEQILKEYAKLTPTYSGKDAAFLEENFESFRKSMLASVRDRIPTTMISLDKQHFRGKRTIALLIAMGIEIPKNTNELAQIFATIYPDNRRENREMRIKMVMNEAIADKVSDYDLKSNIINELYNKLTQTGYL